jgi:hypothetical protein
LYFHRAVLRDSCPDVTLFNASELHVNSHAFAGHRLYLLLNFFNDVFF